MSNDETMRFTDDVACKTGSTPSETASYFTGVASTPAMIESAQTPPYFTGEPHMLTTDEIKAINAQLVQWPEALAKMQAEPVGTSGKHFMFPMYEQSTDTGNNDFTWPSLVKSDESNSYSQAGINISATQVDEERG